MHPYSEILRAIADGKPIQKLSNDGQWHTAATSHVLRKIANCDWMPEELRVK